MEKLLLEKSVKNINIMNKIHKRKLYYCSHSKSCTYNGSCPHRDFHIETIKKSCTVDSICGGGEDDWTFCINVLDPNSNISEHELFKEENEYSLLKEEMNNE